MSPNKVTALTRSRDGVPIVTADLVQHQFPGEVGSTQVTASSIDNHVVTHDGRGMEKLGFGLRTHIQENNR